MVKQKIYEKLPDNVDDCVKIFKRNNLALKLCIPAAISYVAIIIIFLHALVTDNFVVDLSLVGNILFCGAFAGGLVEGTKIYGPGDCKSVFSLSWWLFVMYCTGVVYCVWPFRFVYAIWTMNRIRYHVLQNNPEHYKELNSAFLDLVNKHDRKER